MKQQNIFAETFKAQLNSNIVKFQYTKKNGTIGEGFGTTSVSVIPVENRPKGVLTDEQLASKNAKTICYYDLKKQGWRSFQITADFIVLASIAI